MRGASVCVRGVTHEYGTRDGGVVALDSVDLDVPAGGYVALTGPSGAGKTTLLSLLGGLEPLQSGTMRIDDAELAVLDGDDLARYRRETVGFVFQHFGLVPVLTALENVELALALSGIRRTERLRRSGQLLQAVGLGDRRNHRPAALSGGERQRVAIARAIANHPRLLLADEPTGNLDEDAAASVLRLLEAVRERAGCTLVVVTHNQSVASRAEVRRRIVGGRWAA
jgi:putative ABC transport system ATP-binding protein